MSQHKTGADHSDERTHEKDCIFHDLHIAKIKKIKSDSKIPETGECNENEKKEIQRQISQKSKIVTAHFHHSEQQFSDSTVNLNTESNRNYKNSCS